jgi:peptide/nickel transport system ATP-binding protein
MIQLEHVAKRFGAKQVLRDISLTLSSGVIAGLSGASGEGKSTIARIICRTIKPDSGRVHTEGRICLVPQQPYASLDPMQKAGNAVSEVLLFHRIASSKKDAAKQCLALFAQVGLDAYLAERRPRELSGGQCQRVLIARALALQPSLLIADEATSMLDSQTQTQIIELLCRLVRERHISLLVISHDRQLLGSITELEYYLENGVLRKNAL